MTLYIGQCHITQSRQESSCARHFHTFSSLYLTFLSAFPFWSLNFPSCMEFQLLNSMRINFSKRFYEDSILFTKHKGRDTEYSFLLSFSLNRNMLNKILNMTSTWFYEKEILSHSLHRGARDTTSYKDIKILWYYFFMLSISFLMKAHEVILFFILRGEKWNLEIEESLVQSHAKSLSYLNPHHSGLQNLFSEPALPSDSRYFFWIQERGPVHCK